MLRADGMPALVQQRPVTAGAGTLVLDAACEESVPAVEMDGAAWHGAQAQREPGIRRDVRAVQAGRPRLFRGDGVR